MHYFVTRHKGALNWLRQNVDVVATHLPHLRDLQCIQAGDHIYGTLPVNWVAEVCKRRTHYFHLQVEIPEQLRGLELSAEQLYEMGAQLVEYVAIRPICDQAILQMADQREVFL